jgi:hypothetical protein
MPTTEEVKVIVEETMRCIKSLEPIRVLGSDAWSLTVECTSPFSDDLSFPTADGVSTAADANPPRRIIVRSVCADDVDALIAFLLHGLSARRFFLYIFA